MMFRQKHRSSRAVFKTVFFLVGVIFLITQVSYKFYAFSSQVVFTPSARSAKPALHQHDHRALSLDKRYKAQTLFALPIQPYRHAFIPPFQGSPCFARVTTPLFDRQRTAILLRGPPLAG